MIAVDNIHFVAGWTAYQAKLPRVANPFLYLANPHRLWCLGWDCAHMCELAAMDIHHLPDDVRPTESGLVRLDKSPFAQGQVAYAKSIVKDDCPYEPHTTDWSDWLCGWQFEQAKINLRHLPPQPVERGAWLAGLLLWWRGLWS